MTRLPKLQYWESSLYIVGNSFYSHYKWFCRILTRTDDIQVSSKCDQRPREKVYQSGGGT